MAEAALVLNAGSSSLKFCVFRRNDGRAWGLQSKGQIDGIGSSPHIRIKDNSGEILANRDLEEEVRNSDDALDVLAGWLRGSADGARLVGVGHRVVHGGSHFTGPTAVSPEVIEELKQLIPLAPLHQPHNVRAIEVMHERMPKVPQVACFDTSFHRTMPQVAQLIPLPADLCRDGVQRYGFHGLSYEYIASVLPEVASGVANGRVVVAHLGSGASLCAMKDGKSVDTSFSFTPLDGLCMGTRPGSVDPGAILYLFQNLGLSAKDVETILYKKSGLLGISGISNDMRDLLASSEPRSRLAVDYFVYQAAKEIGSMAAALGGIDALVFTAGIGENSPEIRKRICDASAWLGMELDQSANTRRDVRISTESSEVSVWTIPTDEELMIARHTGTLLGLI
jgi:acetate kinase